MDRFIASLPKTVLAMIVLVIGFGFIIMSDPPQTSCDLQLEYFKEQQSAFLFGSEKKGFKQPPRISLHFETCVNANSPGGCFELLNGMKQFLATIDSIPPSCYETAAEVKEIKEWIWKIIRIMALLAWGERPPLTENQQGGWFDTSDIALFCRLKKVATAYYGSEAWNQFRDSVLQELPGANTLTKGQVEQRSLFFARCDLFK